MTQQVINTGIAANSGTGDTLRTAGIKINANFAELYARPIYNGIPTATNSILGGIKVDGTTITITQSGVISAHTSYSLPIAKANNTITPALGGVIPDGTSITINPATGVISSVGGGNSFSLSVTTRPAGTNALTYSAGTLTFTPYLLPSASTSILGGVKVDGTTITINGSGVISATATNSTYTLPTASITTLGGVKVDGTTIRITNGVISSISSTPSLSVTTNSPGTESLNYANGIFTFTPYLLPTASTGVMGGVKVDGSTITINPQGVITANYVPLVAATTVTLGGVKVDGSTITINASGVISAAAAVTATNGQLGVVKPDGTTITINNGTISAPYTYSLPTASTTVVGGVKVDGTTITINGTGVISATVTSGLASRTTATATTASLSNGTSAPITITGTAKGYALYSIAVSAGAWVTVYNSISSQSSDSSRTISTDPTPGSGVIAEAITTTATTTYFTPAVIGYNADGTPNTNMYLRVVNNSGSSAAITVTLTYLKLEI